MNDQPLRILVSDRSSNVRRLLQREFLSRGYEVASAKSAAEVLSALDSAVPPALLVMDMQLPGCDASGFWERVLVGPAPPFVVIHAFDEDALPAELHGKAARVDKTGDMESLARAVSWCLSQKSRLGAIR